MLVAASRHVVLQRGCAGVVALQGKQCWACLTLPSPARLGQGKLLGPLDSSAPRTDSQLCRCTQLHVFTLL